MNELRTTVRIDESDSKIQHSDMVLTVGSCFAASMGDIFSLNKFDTLVNPFGTLYSPLAIHHALDTAVRTAPPAPDGFVNRNDAWYHYDYHSSLSALDHDELNLLLQARMGQANGYLRKARWIVITYGTAWVYNRKDNGMPVANCHKVPTGNFEKSLLTQKKMLESFEAFYQSLMQFNPASHIILTVSPVRHLKDTLVLNSVSKSVLRLACHTLSTQHNNVHYFPSYEIMIDDLRDYRFYKADMIHPTEQAERMIWDEFAACYFDAHTRRFLDEWTSLRASLSHRPFHPSSAGHQQFLKKLLQRLEELNRHVDVNSEIADVKSRLI